MSFNVISFLKSSLASRPAAPVADDNPLPVTSVASVGGGLTPTDRTVTSATGATQQLAAANASRKGLLIKNGNSPTGVNLLGGSAAIGGAGTITLGAMEGIYLEGPACPVGAINVISTAAAYISAVEYA